MKPRVARAVRAASVAVVTVVAIWLLLAGLLKLQDTSEFSRVLAAQGALPANWASFLSSAIPWSEVVIAVGALLLMLHRHGRAASAILSIVFLTFALYLTWLHLHPPPKSIGCGCGFRSTLVENWAALGAENSMIAVGLILAGLGAQIGRTRIDTSRTGGDSEVVAGDRP